MTVLAGPNAILQDFADRTRKYSEKLIAEAEVARLQRVNKELLDALKECAAAKMPGAARCVAIRAIAKAERKP